MDSLHSNRPPPDLQDRRALSILLGVLLFGLLVGAIELAVMVSQAHPQFTFPGGRFAYHWQLLHGSLKADLALDELAPVILCLLLFLFYTLMAALPVLLRRSLAHLLIPPLLILLVLARAYFYWSTSRLEHVTQYLLPLAANAVLAAAALFLCVLWLRRSEGRMAVWFPLALQLWFQSFLFSD